MKISSSCLLGLCLLAWTSGCGCTRQHARCVEWDGPTCPNSHVGNECGCPQKNCLTKWLKPKCKGKHHGWSLFGGGCPDCEPNPCCGPMIAGGADCAGMPMMQGAVSSNCCGGESMMMGGPVPADASASGQIIDAGGCAGCAGGQVPQVPPAKVTGNCASCGPTVSSAPQPPTTGWSASGSFVNPIQGSVRPTSGNCATGNCQGAVIGGAVFGDGILYDNVTTPAPMPAPTPVPSASISTTLQNAPPPPPPLPGGN